MKTRFNSDKLAKTAAATSTKPYRLVTTLLLAGGLCLTALQVPAQNSGEANDLSGPAPQGPRGTVDQILGGLPTYNDTQVRGINTRASEMIEKIINDDPATTPSQTPGYCPTPTPTPAPRGDGREIIEQLDNSKRNPVNRIENGSQLNWSNDRR